MVNLLLKWRHPDFTKNPGARKSLDSGEGFLAERSVRGLQAAEIPCSRKALEQEEKHQRMEARAEHVGEGNQQERVQAIEHHAQQEAPLLHLVREIAEEH